MKKTILCLVTLVSAASLAQATLILNESFSYPDGALTTVSGGAWANHSGTAGQVDVAAGKVNLSQSESEDVNRLLPGGPFSADTDLYVSFVVNFSTVPSGSGTYFAHFKDTGTGFRCRVFAQATGAATGKYRLGIGNFSVSAASAVVATDLEANTDYKVVLRFRGATNSTLWINPTSESSMVNRADATDTSPNTYAGTYSFALRQGANTQGNCTFDDLLIGTAFSEVQTVGGPPTISGVSDQHIAANSSAGPLPFTVDDVETPAANLVVSANSDNPTLVPNLPANLVLGGSGADRTITIIPAAGQQGTATIQLTVTDGNNDSTSTTFKVYVGEPSISSLANQVTATNTPVGPLAFTVTDAETPNSLTVTAASDNPALIPDANIIVTGSGANRAVTLTPAPDVAGFATITLFVNDGVFSIPTRFIVTVYPKLGLLLSDSFNYPDGSIVGNGGWTSHSGTNGDAQVLSGQLRLTFARSEDISLGMPSPWFYFPTNSGVILYSSFKVNFSALPGTGEYFAHYRDTGTANYRSRVFATTSGAASGKFRIGIANGGFTFATVPKDLSTNTTYLILSRYNVGTSESTVWVNPVSEAGGGATATDLTTPVPVWHACFRQNTGMGTLSVDDFKLGTQWSDVWEATAPEAESLKAERVGDKLVLTWSNPAFGLQMSPSVTGVYTDVPGATSPYTNTISGERYFRLRY